MTPASNAAKRPTGPAPTIRTSVRIGDVDVSTRVSASEVIRYPWCHAAGRAASVDPPYRTCRTRATKAPQATWAGFERGQDHLPLLRARCAWTRAQHNSGNF